MAGAMAARLQLSDYRPAGGGEIPSRQEHDFSSAEGLRLRRTEEAGFEVLVTADKNISYQQNLAAAGVSVMR